MSKTSFFGNPAQFRRERVALRACAFRVTVDLVGKQNAN